MNHLCRLSITLIGLIHFLNAQGDAVWTRTYGGSGDDVGYSVQQTTDGGFVVVGYTSSFGAGESDVWLIRTDATGDTFWTRTYGGSSEDVGQSVQQTTDGGFVVAGYTGSFGAGGADVWLIRTDANGDTLWTRTYGGSGTDVGNSVQQTSDSGFVVAGYTGSFGAGGDDVWLIRTDAQGDTLWTRTYGGSSWEEGNSVQQTSDGGFVVAGRTTSFGAGGSDVWLIRTDTQGNTIWARTFGDTLNDVGHSVQLTADSGFVVAGFTYGFGAERSDVLLIETDPQGDSYLANTFGGNLYDVGCSVQQTADRGFVVAGWVGESAGFGGAYPDDVKLIRTDTYGMDTTWTRTYGGSSEDVGYSVQQTADGGFVVAGATESFGAGESDIWLIKTDSLGNTAPLAVHYKEPALPEVYSLHQNFPNPFNPASAIRYDLPLASEVSLIVYDLLGREVARLVDGYRESGYHVATWDARNFASGIYIARLVTSEYSKSIKMLLLK